MGDYSVEIGYSLDLSHIRKGVDEFNKLSIEVGSVSKQIDSISDSASNMIKSLSNAASSINSTKETVAGVAEAVSKVNKTVSDLDNQSGSNKKPPSLHFYAVHEVSKNVTMQYALELEE